ncbi:PRC-barrel domain containing protein [bacterium]|nr:MAG: PRC-barrel domain containing protein [bacterium]
MTLADLRRKPIVSIGDGVKVGEVDDFVVDPSQWSVRDIYVHARTGEGLLPWVHIRNIGPDAITVDSAQAIEWAVPPTALRFTKLADLTVVDGSGTVIGHIAEMSYDTSGRIEWLEVHRGGVLGLGVHVTRITPAEIRGVGDRLVTVELAVAGEAVEQ